MPASRIPLALFLIGLFVASASAAEVREWTDAKGQKLSGALEEITDDGKVKINSNGQTFTIPIERFSDEDKKYIDSQRESMGDADDDKPTRRSRRSDLFDYRQWTDKQGNEIKAKFVRMHEGQVVLLQGRTAHKVSFYDLGDEDQVYLRGELENRGEDDQIPDPPAVNTNSGGEGNPNMGGNGPRMGNMPSIPPSPYAPTGMDDFVKQQREQHEKNRREIEKRAEEQRRAMEEAVRRRQEESQRREMEIARQEAERDQALSNQHQSMVNRMNQMSSNMESQMNQQIQDMQQMELVEYKYCTKCNKEIPDHIGAGDNCPHCGIYFAEETDRFGNTTKKAPIPWIGKGGIWSGAMLGGLIGGIVGVIKWLMKKAG